MQTNLTERTCMILGEDAVCKPGFRISCEDFEGAGEYSFASPHQ